MLTRQNLLLWWGLTVTLAYVATEALGHALPKEQAHSAVLWTWTAAMAVPVLLTLLLGARTNALIWVWAGATALALAENFWAHASEQKAVMHFSFHPLWFLFGALGFAYTAAVVDGANRKKLYGAAAALNLLGLVVALAAPKALEGIDFLVLAAIQGVPMLLDLPLRRRAEAAAD